MVNFVYWCIPLCKYTIPVYYLNGMEGGDKPVMSWLLDHWVIWLEDVMEKFSYWCIPYHTTVRGRFLWCVWVNKWRINLTTRTVRDVMCQHSALYGSLLLLGCYGYICALLWQPEATSLVAMVTYIAAAIALYGVGVWCWTLPSATYPFSLF